MKYCHSLLIFLALSSIMAAPAQANFFTFIDNGPSSNRVDIVFLGDGYTSKEKHLYYDHIIKMVNHLFDEGQDPFPRYLSCFNAHIIHVISQQSGADDPSVGTFVNTALDATFLADGVSQRLLYINSTKADTALSAGLGGAFTADVKLVTVNTTQYGGGGGTYAVYAGGNSAAPEVALHELGHSFAGLADEYGGSFTTPYTGSEPSEPNATKDPTGAKWARWNGYVQPGIGTIGAYDGGRYYDNGIYRPSLNSKMRQLGQPFDAVSREEFILDIYRIVDPLDAWLSNAEPLSNPIKLWVDSISPEIIQNQWLVNGLLVDGATGEEFDPLAFGFGPGTYTVTSHNFDPTDWVRSHPDLVNQDISWTVTYTVPEPSSFLLVAGAVCCLAIRRTRKGK